MGNKMKLIPSLLKNSHPFSCPSCRQPRTLSFRHYNNKNSDNIVNNDNNVNNDGSAFTEDAGDGESIESVIRGLRSDRLFFEPDETSSIMEAKSALATTSTFKDSIVMSMESKDPYVDFRKSMEEMVEAHAVKDWDALEELLGWYLRVNDKSNHAYIVSAFVDLLAANPFPSASLTSTSNSSHPPSSPLSFYTTSSLNSSFSTPCASCLEIEEETDTPSPRSLFLQKIRQAIRREDGASSSSSPNV